MLKIPEYYPDISIKLILGNGKVHGVSQTFDKNITSLGYIPVNIVVMAEKANTLKSNGTSEEHKQLIKWMEEQNL